MSGQITRCENGWGLLVSEERTYFFRADAQLTVGDRVEFQALRMANSYVTRRAGIQAVIPRVESVTALVAGV
jgi:hypothetical protein